MQPLEGRKGKEMDSPPEPPKRVQTTLEFEPSEAHVGLLASRTVQIINLCCFKPVSLW